MLDLGKLKDTDLEVYNSIMKELERQNDKIELIASENYTSEAVMQAQGSYNTNKYAEGYPGARYYGGCENVDVVEDLARERCKKLFNAEHANVQPHSGAQANAAVCFAACKVGDTIMGMTLNSGGHLTHGAKPTFSGKYFNSVQYDVNPDTFLLDYDEIEKKALEAKPRLLIAGASAYPRTIDFKRFRQIADKVNELIKQENPEEYEENKCLLMVDMAHIAGLVVAGLHPSPVPYADFVTSTTHKTLRGPRGGIILCKEEWAKKIDKAVFPGIQGGPLEHVIAAKAVAFGEALKPEFKEYQAKVVENAKCFEENLKKLNVDMVAGGTDNHLILIDLRNREVKGKELETRLDNIGITVNKNAVPFDTEPKSITSGIRIGTPAITTRGFGKEEIELISKYIDICSDNSKYEQEGIIQEMKENVLAICNKFPIYR